MDAKLTVRLSREPCGGVVAEVDGLDGVYVHGTTEAEALRRLASALEWRVL